MLVDTLNFLLTVSFDCYISIILLRFMLQWLGASYYNPISQFCVKLTEPLLKPMRKRVPNLKGIDWASIILMLLLAVLKNAVLLRINTLAWPFFPGLLLLALANLLSLMLSLLLYAIVLRVLLSWLNPRGYNPASEVIIQLTEPLLQKVRTWLPSMAGLDLSPLVIIVLIQLLNLVFINRLLVLSKGLAILG